MPVSFTCRAAPGYPIRPALEPQGEIGRKHERAPEGTTGERAPPRLPAKHLLRLDPDRGERAQAFLVALQNVTADTGGPTDRVHVPAGDSRGGSSTSSPATPRIGSGSPHTPPGRDGGAAAAARCATPRGVPPLLGRPIRRGRIRRTAPASCPTGSAPSASMERARPRGWEGAPSRTGGKAWAGTSSAPATHGISSPSRRRPGPTHLSKRRRAAGGRRRQCRRRMSVS